MAITVMATAGKTNRNSAIRAFFLTFLFITSPSILAGEWEFVPNLGLTETFTDNIELSKIKPKSSLVSQVIVGIDTDFKAKQAYFSFSATETFAAYSHNSELNDDFQTMNLKGLFSFWQDGPQLTIGSDISNISKNEYDNQYADLISGDTIQQQTHNAGLQYIKDNSDVKLESSITYDMINTEDNIGESTGYVANISSNNGSSARYIFWQIDGNYTYRENNDLNGKSFAIETKLGFITPYKFNPFIRYYNEEVTGNVSGSNPNSIPAWGPGIRYLVARHFLIDVSYNYVQDDNNVSDDFIAASINWQPSIRTSLKAGYSKRFFGDSYNLDFIHRSKRLDNKISYHETLEVFDRNSFQENELGLYWCPITEGQLTAAVEECFVPSTPPDQLNNLQLVPLTSLTLIQNNEFTLNKRIAWQSTLALSRTTFIFDLSGRERTSLSTDVVDEYIDASIKVTRKTSAKSDISLSATYSENILDKNSLSKIRQKDIYKIVSSTYNRSLASSLNAYITLRYLDRQSSQANREYQEVRASINITKDF